MNNKIEKQKQDHKDIEEISKSLPSGDRLQASFRQMDFETKKALGIVNRAKAKIREEGMSDEIYNRLAIAIESIDNSFKLNNEMRMPVSRLFSSINKFAKNNYEDPLELAKKEIQQIMKDYALEKQKAEQLRLEAERKEQEKTALISRESLRLKECIVDSLQEKIQANINSIENKFKTIEGDRKPFLETVKSSSNHIRKQDSFLKIINSFASPVKDGAIADLNFSFDDYKAEYIKLSGDTFLELADSLENGYSTDSIIEESKEHLDKAKEAIETDKQNAEIERVFSGQVSSQESSAPSNIQSKRTFVECNNKQAILLAVGKYLSDSEIFDASKFDFMFKKLLSKGVEVKGAVYKDDLIVSKKSRI